MNDVLVIGVAVVDFIFAVDAFPDRAAKYRARGAEVVGGGCAANAAVAIARLGGVARIGARLGDDPLGDLIVDDLVAEGVDTSLVRQSEGARSSFSSVFVDAQGERQIMNFRGSGLTAETGWIRSASRCGAVLADTRWSEGATEALRLARDWNVPGVVDAEAPMDEDVLAEASHIAFSRDGLLSFAGAGDLLAALARADEVLPGWVCVTDGAEGTWHMDGGRPVHSPAFPVEVKDTLAAGDVWHGAFALALAEGQDERRAVRFANAAAGLKCTTFGGRKGCPSRAELDQFLKEMT